MASYFHDGGYGTPIHEQMEMAVTCFGQIEMNNQPAFAMQAMQVAFEATGSVTGPIASRAQKRLRESMGLFVGGGGSGGGGGGGGVASMYPGDEDNGSMGAWYVLTALGLYPLSPASGDYLLGSPLFANVSITLPSSSSSYSSSSSSSSSSSLPRLTVAALNQGPDNVYVQGVTWKGAAVEGLQVAYADLVQGGELVFTMGPEPYSTSASSASSKLL